MAQSVALVYLHSVFSTKYRKKIILPDVENDLYNYIGGIIKGLNGNPVAINGMPDHIHILSTLPRTVTIAKYLEEIKKNSSRWIKHQADHYQCFGWQNGYATFSVDWHGVEKVKRYIQNQKRHHRTEAYERELIRLLDRAGIEYDERYLWD